jgi:hypothetical protein
MSMVKMHQVFNLILPSSRLPRLCLHLPFANPSFGMAQAFLSVWPKVVNVRRGAKTYTQLQLLVSMA